MDIYRLAYWLEDLTPVLVDLDGYIFVSGNGIAVEALQTEAKQYASLAEAQEWMNIVLFDDFISEVVGEEWSIDDPSADSILSIFAAAWSHQMRSAHPGVPFVIDKLRDEDAGDFGLRLRQTSV